MAFPKKFSVILEDLNSLAISQKYLPAHLGNSSRANFMRRTRHQRHKQRASGLPARGLHFLWDSITYLIPARRLHFFFGFQHLPYTSQTVTFFLLDSNTYIIPARRLHFFVGFQHWPYTSQKVTFFYGIPTLTLYQPDGYIFSNTYPIYRGNIYERFL